MMGIKINVVHQLREIMKNKECKLAWHDKDVKKDLNYLANCYDNFYLLKDKRRDLSVHQQ